MKTLILTLSVFLLSFSQLEASCGFLNFSQQECCIRVQPDGNRGSTWYLLDYGDGTVIAGAFNVITLNGNVHEHCYTTSGPHTVTLTYYNQFGVMCGATQNIVISETCSGECTSYLCWEDFIGYFNTAESVTIQIGSGQFVTIPFFNSVTVNGGYNAIMAELTAALTAYGITSPVNSSGPQQDCTKGNDPTPGFFLTDPIKIISINGDNATASALFNHDNCP